MRSGLRNRCLKPAPNAAPPLELMEGVAQASPFFPLVSCVVLPFGLWGERGQKLVGSIQKSGAFF